MKLNNKCINDSASLAVKAAESYKQTVMQEQLKCQHRTLAECDYEDMNFISSLPPKRICLDCGITEDGWGCGYIVLTTVESSLIYKIERNQLYKLMVGLRIREDDKGPLLRGESTVEDLIRSV